jgi:hypothetical protein
LLRGALRSRNEKAQSEVRGCSTARTGSYTQVQSLEGEHDLHRCNDERPAPS